MPKCKFYRKCDMGNKNLNCVENYSEDDISIFFVCFLLGSFGLILLVIYGIYSYIQNPTDFDILYYIKNTLILLMPMVPFTTVLVTIKLERYKINKKNKLFDKLLADHVLFSLLDDKELKREWSVFRKMFLLRIDELVQQFYINKINYKYDGDINVNNFIVELMSYKKEKDNKYKALASQIKTEESNKIKDQADCEKAIDLLNKYKNQDGNG